MSLLANLRAALNSNLDRLEQAIANNTTCLPPHLFEAKPYPLFDDAYQLPPQHIFDLVEKIRLDLKAVDSLITPTRFKLVEQGMLSYKVAALNTAVGLRIADHIEKLGGSASLADLAKEADVNTHKLGRILRVLAAEFIFQETSPDVFANTRHSIALAGSTGARSFLSFIGDLGMKSALGIPADLTNPRTKHSFEETDAPFCTMVSKDGRTFAQYMADPSIAAMVELSGEGVVGWLNKLTRASLLNDYPWDELGDATVIDLGAGMGDSGMDVVRQYPRLKWVYQDLDPVIDALEQVCPFPRMCTRPILLTHLTGLSGGSQA
jgi:hypothetical protein